MVYFQREVLFSVIAPSIMGKTDAAIAWIRGNRFVKQTSAMRPLNPVYRQSVFVANRVRVESQEGGMVTKETQHENRMEFDSFGDYIKQSNLTESTD